MPRLRFLFPKSRLGDAQLCHLTGVDGHDTWRPSPCSRTTLHSWRAAGAVCAIRSGPTRAEVAITVGDALQGMGLGRTLGTARADVGTSMGIRRFTSSLLGTNVAAHRLFHAISRRVQTQYSGGIADLVVELDAREHPILPAAHAA